MLNVTALKALGNNPQGFLNAVTSESEKLGIRPEWLLTAFWMESRFNPKALNPATNAAGLFQLMPATLKPMGITTNQVLNMTAYEQVINLVPRYFKPYKGKMKSLVDVYLAIFYPAAIGKSDKFSIGTERSASFAALVAKQNGIYDLNKDGYVTKGEVSLFIQKTYFDLFPDEKKTLWHRAVQVYSQFNDLKNGKR